LQEAWRQEAQLQEAWRQEVQLQEAQLEPNGQWINRIKIIKFM